MQDEHIDQLHLLRSQRRRCGFWGVNIGCDKVGMKGDAYVTRVENVLSNIVVGVGDDANQSDYVGLR